MAPKLVVEWERQSPASTRMIELSDVFGILRRRLIWLVLSPLVFAALALAYLTFKTPLYSATAELLIEPDGIPIIAAPGAASSAPSFERVDIESQGYILLSGPVLNDISDKLNLDEDSGLHRLGLRQKLLGAVTPEQTATEKRQDTLKRLREAIEVSRLDRSFVFQIQATHPDPLTAAAIANETAASYIEQTRNARTDSLVRTSESLSKQALSLRVRLDEAEKAVEDYKAKNGLISTGQGGLVVDQQLQDINTQITAARVDLEKAKTAFDLVRRLTAADVEAGAIPVTSVNSVLSSLRVQYATIAQRLAEAETTLGSNHPQLRELKSQTLNTKRLISEELQRMTRSLRSDYEQSKATLAALEAQSSALKSANSTQGQALITLRQLESEASASRSVYEAFLKRSRELAEQQELDTNSSRILSDAQPPSSANGPSRIIVLLAAGMFGFAAASGTAVGLAILNGQMTSEQDLVTRTGVPILSSLPPTQSTSSFSLLTRQSSLEEAEREHFFGVSRIAYALRHAFSDTRPATILVLSADKAIDTETLARDLAENLYGMDEEVLLARTTHTKSAALPNYQRQRSGLPATQDLRRSTSNRLARYLSVERVSERRKYASVAPLDQAFEDFLIIDGGSAFSSPILPVLLAHSDGIVLVSSMNSTSSGDLDKTLAYLKPWQDRVIGNVVLDAA